MGYYIDQVGSYFEMKADNVPKAFAALQKFFSPKSDNSQEDLSFIESESVLDAPTFDKAMSEARWDITTNDAGDVIDIWFNGEKYGDEETVLKQIAPFVEDGSYIIMQGEEGERWKWKFKDGLLFDVSGRFVFDDDDE